jgi:hypothetical protein
MLLAANALPRKVKLKSTTFDLDLAAVEAAIGPKTRLVIVKTPHKSDRRAELEQFVMDAWRAPKRLFHIHPPDQDAQLRLDLRSPSPCARLPTPVATKSGSVPTHKRLRPDESENLSFLETSDTGGQRNQRSWFVSNHDHAASASRQSTDVGVPHFRPQAGSST